MTTKELLNQALLLPVEERAFLADTLFKSLNQIDPAVDEAWLAVVQQRWQEIQSHQVDLIAGDDVFTRLRSQFKPS